MGGGRGSFPSVVSPCRLWLTGGSCPLQQRTSGKCHDQPHASCALTDVPSSAPPSPAPASVSVRSQCSHRSSHSITTRLLLSCLVPVLHRCMCWFLTQNWAVREAVAQHRGCLALNSQTWSQGRCISEWSCLFLQFSLHVYNIAINSTGEEIPSKNVAYSYQAMS